MVSLRPLPTGWSGISDLERDPPACRILRDHGCSVTSHRYPGLWGGSGSWRFQVSEVLLTRELLSAALQRGLPVLGICRGLQVINVAMGGSLHQHLPDVVDHHGHASAPGSYSAHPVRVSAGSELARILGRTQVEQVPSHHHQAVERLGDGLTAVAWSDDGLIEAIALDAPGCPFTLAVQWHPEVGDDLSLFHALVVAARTGVHAAALAP